YESTRRMLSELVYDVIAASKEALGRLTPMDVAAVRAAPALIAFTPQARAQSAELKHFLLRNLYRHPRVMDTTGQAQQVVRDLFGRYLAAPAEMQAGYAARADAPRAVADYIAGMTDRFALREHERLTGLRLLVAPA